MALRAALGRGNRGAGAKELESLDICIQHTLSALYPPFEATAATVLWQLFSVAEKLYRGDGLRCLTDFLIPARRALQHLQQEACARYTGLLFLHEGWPLCIHEKVVVQLASLRGVRLRPGDFYLQITAAGRQSARLVLKCLSRLGRGSEEVAVPEAMYGCVFTGEFLELVNGERNSVPLQNCLLTSGSAVYRTPWSNVTDPIFVPTKGTVLPSCPGRPRPSSVLEAPAPAPAMASPPPQGHTPALSRCGGHPGSDQPRCLPSPRRAECESPRTLSRGPNGGPEGVSPSEQEPWEPPESPGGPGGRLDTVDKKDGPQALASLADRGGPSSRRRPPGAPASVEARRRFRKSYVEALRNPMPLGSSSEEAIGDEACGSQTQGRRTRGAEAAASLTHKEPPGPWGDHREPLSQESGPGATRRTLPRRSRSWDRTLRGSRDDRRQASHHSASTSPEGLLGGPAMETRPAGSSHAGTAENPSGTSQEADVAAEGDSFRGVRPSQRSDVLPEQLCPEGEGHRMGDLLGQVPRRVLEINQELLQSGVVTLPGTRDRQGRAVVQVCLRGLPWSSEHPSSAELTRLLRYLHTIPRKEVRELGLVILVDARKSLATPVLSQALAALQNTSPPIIHSILLLVDKESAFRPDKDATIQCELVGSLKALHKLVDSTQLTAALEGSFPYSHRAWICFRQKLEPFTASCEEAIVFLQNSIRSLHTHRTPSTAQEVAELISTHKATMKCVLEDARLVALRLEGGAVLAWLRREGPGAGHDCRDATEAASRLYSQVDEEVHRLVLTSNRCLRELEVLQEGGEQGRTLDTGKFPDWGSNQSCSCRPAPQCGIRGLNCGLEKNKSSSSGLWSCPLGFPARLTRRHREGLQLMEKDSRGTEDGTQDFGRCPSPMASPAEQREGGQACLSEFCETVSRWTPQCSACLENPGPELAAEDLKSCRQKAIRSFPRASEAVASSDLCLQRQQTGVHWQEALGEASPGPGTPALGRSPLKHKRRPLASSWIPLGCAGAGAALLPSLPGQAAPCGREGAHLGPGVHAQNSGPPCPSEPTQTPAVHPRKHPLREATRKTQSFEIPKFDSAPRDSYRLGHTGVSVGGLEVTSTVASEKQPPRRPRAESPPHRGLSSPSRIHPSGDGRARAGR